MLNITPLQPSLGARIRGLDLTRDIDDETFAAVRDAFERYSVLVFPDQRITDEQQIRFSERFGPLEATRAGANGAGSKLIVLTNITADGSIGAPSDKQVLNNRANQIWHADSSFKPMPARASLLSAREIPSQGGDTQYASMRAAYAALPDEDKRLVDGLDRGARFRLVPLAHRPGAGDGRRAARRTRRCARPWWSTARTARRSTSAPMPGGSRAWTRRKAGP